MEEDKTTKLTAREIFESYKPPKFKTNGNMMTIMSKFAKHMKVNYIRERLRTPDKDFFDLDWTYPNDKKEPKDYEGMILIIHHGLGGSSQSQYVLRLSHICKINGIISVSVNARCSSGEPNETINMYSAGSTNDIKQTLTHVSELYPRSKIYLIGYSIGGCIVSNAIGELCKDKQVPTNLKGGITISSPVNLSLGTEFLNKSKMGKIYTVYLLNGLHRMLKQKLKIRQMDDERIKKGIKAKTIKDFDDALTAPLRGWKDSEEYYKNESPSNVLGYVDIPLCMLHSEDDPIVNIEGATRYVTNNLEKNKFIDIYETSSGGHCIFESTSDQFWLEHFIITWCEEH